MYLSWLNLKPSKNGVYVFPIQLEEVLIVSGVLLFLTLGLRTPIIQGILLGHCVPMRHLVECFQSAQKKCCCYLIKNLMYEPSYHSSAIPYSYDANLDKKTNVYMYVAVQRGFQGSIKGDIWKLTWLRLCAKVLLANSSLEDVRYGHKLTSTMWCYRNPRVLRTYCLGVPF